jgi:hypothetical protein
MASKREAQKALNDLLSLEECIEANREVFEELAKTDPSVKEALGFIDQVGRVAPRSTKPKWWQFWKRKN